MAVHLAVQRVGVAGDGGDMHAALAQHGGHAVAHQRGIVGDDHPQGAAGERIPPRGHDDMAPAQAAQLELAIVLEPQLLPEVLVRLGELPDHAGEQDLAPARQVGDSRRLDHGTSAEVILADGRLSGVHSHTHAHVRDPVERQRALDIDRTTQRRPGAREGQQMPVAERLDQRAAVLGNACAQQRLVLGQPLQPARLPEAREQRGRALDIGEEDRDRPTRDRASGLRNVRWHIGARHLHIVTHGAIPW
jgi:hypothetical protein